MVVPNRDYRLEGNGLEWLRRSIPGRGSGRPARIPVGAGRAEVGFRANKKPRKPFGLRGLCGSGRSPRALSRLHTLGRSRFRGRCVSRRHSPRQAEFRSHSGTVPAVSSRNLSSEASAPGSDVPCRGPRAGRGADTPAKVLRVGTVTTGTAPGISRPLAPCYGSDLLPLRLRFAFAGG